VDDIKDVVDMLSPFYGVVYSDVVLMKVRYIFDRICLQRRPRKLSMLYARLRHQYRSLDSDVFRIHITNDSKW
jgi:hypothetical protein